MLFCVDIHRNRYRIHSIITSFKVFEKFAKNHTVSEVLSMGWKWKLQTQITQHERFHFYCSIYYCNLVVSFRVRIWWLQTMVLTWLLSNAHSDRLPMKVKTTNIGMIHFYIRFDIINIYEERITWTFPTLFLSKHFCISFAIVNFVYILLWYSDIAIRRNSFSSVVAPPWN